MMNLISKYDQAGPRYTSYPPAPLFSADFGPEDYQRAILQTEKNPQNKNISLYVHIPFCDSLCYFCGCTTVITKNTQHLQQYLEYLKKEINLLAPLVHPERKVVQMHWGGGTPTYLSPTQLYELGSSLRHFFSFEEDAEMSVEIDPREVTFHHLKALREIGFNRISLGVQDFNPKVQQAINRNQSEFITQQAIDWSRKLGFSSINIDLIYGLPHQTVCSFSETLDAIVKISPERIAVYNFAYVPWMKRHQKLIHGEDLPSSQTKVEILSATIERLTESGYEYIGMDHFARPTDELTLARKNRTLHRNFQGYSTKAGADLYGIGMSSISHFGTYYAQNEKTLREYYQALNNGRFATHVGYRMTKDDEIRKFVIMRLMCDLILDIAEVEHRFDIEFSGYFSLAMRKLEPLIEDGLVHLSGTTLTVSPIGRLFLRNIAMCFDAYLSENVLQQRRYSKTV
jgi:oxygen-independent coproporphyrinogen-3 oxidase